MRSLRGAVTRPARPKRCTLPITAFRLMPPPITLAMWLAESPSVQSDFSCSMRSSVQLIIGSLCAPTKYRIGIRGKYNDYGYGAECCPQKRLELCIWQTQGWVLYAGA